MQVLLVTCGSWHLPHTAAAFAARDALAGLWTSDRVRTQVPTERCRRAWPFQLAMQLPYRLAPQIVVERLFYTLFPLWQGWLRSQSFPRCQVVQAIMGYATEPFDQAERLGALKVIDCQNSHPTSYYGYWQRECDLWCPGARVPIPRWMFARMTRELARADVVLCPSLFVRDSMVRNGVPEAKCVLAPFGVNTNVFTPRVAVPPTPRFVTVGTICLRKGHQYLFRAFERVKRALPAAELVCVGGYKTDFRHERPRWEGSFTSYPSLTHTQIAELLQSATAFVFPSVEEGFARVIPEAMACGVPIIASYESGATTLVDHEREGLIVPAQDVDQIAQAMIRLATQPDLNQRLGTAAQQRGAKGNSWQNYGDRLLQEFAGRLSANRPATTGPVALPRR